MQFQLEPRESFAKLFQEPLRIEMMFKAEHEVVGIANDDDVTMSISPPPLLNPQVERVACHARQFASVDEAHSHKCDIAKIPTDKL